MTNRVNIALTESTHMQAKLIAVIKKKTLAAYLEDAICSAVEKDHDLLRRAAR